MKTRLGYFWKSLLSSKGKTSGLQPHELFYLTPHNGLCTWTTQNGRITAGWAPTMRWLTRHFHWNAAIIKAISL